MPVFELDLPPHVEPSPAKMFVGNTVVMANDARVLICAIDATWITGIVLQGIAGDGGTTAVGPTGAVRFRRTAVVSCHGEVSFDFDRAMAHDKTQDIVLRCKRTSLNQITLEPMVTKRRPMPNALTQMAAMNRVFGCWTTLCELALPRGVLPGLVEPQTAEAHSG